MPNPGDLPQEDRFSRGRARAARFEQVRPLLHHIRLARLLEHFPPRLVWAFYVFANGFITIGLLAGVAWLTDSDFIFPSLGPTAYLVFFAPRAEASSPRNTVLGHAIGLVCGYGALQLTGAVHLPPFGVHAHIYGARILAAVLSLAATGAGMVLLKASHPPAGATTLIVSLGIITEPKDLAVIELAVCLLSIQAIVINRLAGLDYPFWGRKPSRD